MCNTESMMIRFFSEGKSRKKTEKTHLIAIYYQLNHLRTQKNGYFFSTDKINVATKVAAAAETEKKQQRNSDREKEKTIKH